MAYVLNGRWRSSLSTAPSGGKGIRRVPSLATLRGKRTTKIAHAGHWQKPNGRCQDHGPSGRQSKYMKKLLILATVAAMLVGCGKTKPAVDIWTAVGTGNIVAIKQNLAAGIDVNANEPTGGSTPLMIAALFGRTEAATLLIQKGAKIDAKKYDGATALHVAAFFCQPETAQLLL